MGAVVELMDDEWDLVQNQFDPPVHRGVKGSIPRREIVDAFLAPLRADRARRADMA